MAADSPLAVFPSIDQMAETEAPEVAAVGVGAPVAGETEAAAPAEAGPTLAERVSALKEPPYSDETLAKMGDFFIGRKRDVKSFFYTTGGDLEIKEGATLRKRGKPLPGGVIQLKRFLPLEVEERAVLDDARLEDLAEVEQRFEEATQRLRDAWANHEMAVAAGGSTGSEVRAVVAANQQVAELDAERNAIRSAMRVVTTIPNPLTREILLDQFYETRKLFRDGAANKNVYRLAMSDFKPEHFYGKYVPDEAVAEAEEAVEEDAAGIKPDEAAFRTKIKDGRIARIFFDTGKSPINDPLSPFWPIKLQIRETQYNFPLQAYEAERAKEFKKDTLRENIMKATSTRTIRLLTRAEEGDPADARGLWKEIYTAIAQQHPEWKASLLATATDALVYADPRKGSSGIGVDAASPDALDPTKWKGENIVGIVLETLRTQIREETVEEAPTGEVKEAAITEEQAQANRIGAIVNAARRRNAGGF
jgi:predicted NAD-dependent protein-ADP-ribosyltransferase YbiA (DUF1768 family)